MPAKPKDAGLEEIAAWQRWLVDGNVQQMRDNGYDDETIARERVGLEALAGAIADRMRADYRSNQSRGQL
jgi:hypothetical protein